MKPADPNPKAAIWITPREAAEYLNVGVDIIYDGCAAGGLKHMRLGHRTIRLRREWLDAWAEEHRASRSEVRPCLSEGAAASETSTRSTAPSAATAIP